MQWLEEICTMHPMLVESPPSSHRTVWVNKLLGGILCSHVSLYLLS